MAKSETTTSYRWDEQSLIQRIDVREQSNGQAVAYLYANPDPALKDKRMDVRQAIRLKGWGTLSDHRGGEFALRVSGLKNGAELINLLQRDGIITTQPQISSGTIAPEESKGVWESLKANSLRVSALAYTAGNILYWISGQKASPINADRKKMAIAFGVGDAALGIFGGRDDSRQYRSLLGKLKSHYETEGIEMPQTASIHIETRPFERGALGWANDMLHTHINSIKMAAEVAGGFFALKSGLKGDGVKKNMWEVVGGSIVMAGWAGALLTPEKKRDPEKLQNAGFYEKAKAWVQERPTRLAGLAGYCFNFVGGANFWSKRNTAEGKWGLGAIGTMVGANSFYAISHKSPGGDIKTREMVSDVYTVAAQIINKQPEELRERAIESTARFLGERPEVPGTHSEVLERLREEIEIQRKNPWFEQRGLGNYTPQPKARPVVHLAETPAHHAAVNDNDTAVQTRASPSTTLAAANDREHEMVAQLDKDLAVGA